MKGYEENLGEPLRAVREDVEKEWSQKLEAEVRVREEKEAWADELVKQLDKERKVCLLGLFRSTSGGLTIRSADAHQA